MNIPQMTNTVSSFSDFSDAVDTVQAELEKSIETASFNLAECEINLRMLKQKRSDYAQMQRTVEGLTKLGYGIEQAIKIASGNI